MSGVAMVMVLTLGFVSRAEETNAPAAGPEEITNAPVVDQEEVTNAPAVGPARVSLGVLVGEEDQEYRMDGLVPLWAPDDSRLFLDLGGSLLEDEEQEVNVGVLARHLLSEQNVIVGASLAYDTRWTDNDNQFDQVSGGLELMSRRIDVRMHYSYPLTDRKTLSEMSTSATAVSTDSNRKITTTTSTMFRSYEEALEGYDAEVGVWAPFLEETAPTAFYVGYFNYESEDQSDFSGVRARVESRLHPQVTLDVGWQELTEDDEDEFFVGVRVYLPWDIWNGCRTVRADADSTEDWSLRSRLDEIPHRINRVRTETTTARSIESAIDEAVIRTGGTEAKVCTPALDSNGNVIVICN